MEAGGEAPKDAMTPHGPAQNAGKHGSGAGS
jgi:hypothetical protein